MDHSQAMETRAAERYALGEMDAPERDLYEEHYFGCPECAEEVKAAVRFLDAAQPVVRESELAPAPDGRPASRHASVAAGWPGIKTLFWPIPLGAIAALVLVLGGPAVYLAVVRVARLERSLAAAEALQPAPWHFLSVSRSEPPTLTVSAGEHWIGLTLSRSSDRSFPYYRCELRDASDRTLLSSVIPNTPGRDELQILIPADRLRSAAYVVAVAGLESPSSRTPTSELTRYHFKLAREAARNPDEAP